jgi:DNA repair protein RadD
MFYFLDRIPRTKLVRFLEREIPTIDCLDSKSQRSMLYGFLFAVCGFDVLYSKHIRILILEFSDAADLKRLCSRLDIKERLKEYDLALKVANLKWRHGARVVDAFQELFGIDEEFLPSRPTIGLSSKTVNPISPLPALFDYQREVMEQVVLDLEQDNTTTMLIQLPTGSGKTRTLLTALVQHINNKLAAGERITVLWAAHTQELCLQAYEAFESIWSHNGNSPFRLSKAWGTNTLKLTDVLNAFVVVSYQKLHALYKSESVVWEHLVKDLDTFVIDEAHKALAPTMLAVIKIIRKSQENSVNLIGLTATPGRYSDDVQGNRKLAELFGSQRITAKSLGEHPITTLQERGILARIRIAAREMSEPLELSDSERRNLEFAFDVPTAILKRLSNNPVRNELILSIIHEQIQLGKSVLVFACSVEHAKRLAVESTQYGARAASVDYSMRTSLREKVLSSFKEKSIDVLFNFGVLSTGFDAPNIDVVIIARPTSSIVLYSQMIGRGLRGPAVGGTEVCELIDIRDNLEAFGDLDEVYAHFEDYWDTSTKRINDEESC